MEDLIWDLYELPAPIQLFMIIGVPLLISYYILSHEQHDLYNQMLGWFVLKAVGSLGMVMMISRFAPDMGLEIQLLSRASIVEIVFTVLFIFVFRHCFKSVLGWTLLILDAFRILMVTGFFPLSDAITDGQLFAIYSSTIYSLIGIAIFGIRNTASHPIEKFY